jgi:hypothetical protein
MSAGGHTRNDETDADLDRQFSEQSWHSVHAVGTPQMFPQQPRALESV